MTYSPVTIANYFIQKSIDEKDPISPMKLQKLIYFAHGWHLALKDEPLITDAIQAWQFGPVIKDLYHKTKHWGNSSITSLLPPSEIIDFSKGTPGVESLDKETISFLDSVWSTYSQYSAIKLSNATHVDGSPWDQVIKKNGGVDLELVIENRIIQKYFKERAEAARQTKARQTAADDQL